MSCKAHETEWADLHKPATAAEGVKAGFLPSTPKDAPVPLCSIANFCLCSPAGKPIRVMSNRLVAFVTDLKRSLVKEGRIFVRISCEDFAPSAEEDRARRSSQKGRGAVRGEESEEERDDEAPAEEDPTSRATGEH